MQLADLLVSLVVVMAHYWTIRIFERDALGRFPRPAYKGILVVLYLLWLVIALGLLANLTRSMPANGFIAWLRSTCAALTLMWGIVSASSLCVYLLIQRTIHKAEVTGVSRERRQVIQAAGAALMAAPLGIIGFGGIVERTAFEVKEVDVPITGLHPDLDGLRIVQLSDLHVSPYLSLRQLTRVVDMANELKPYIVAVTGDLISAPGDPLDGTIRELARLRAEHGIYGCLGNHEVYAKVEGYTVEMSARYGMDFLRARNVEVRRGSGVFNLAGVDFEHFDWRNHYLDGAEELVRPGMPNVLLSHNPDVFPTAARKGFDLTLGGHTHGGQVTVEILKQTANFARFFTPYVAGLYQTGDKSCYVTTGIGTIGMPVRIGATPEITLVRLRRAGSPKNS